LSGSGFSVPHPASCFSGARAFVTARTASKWSGYSFTAAAVRSMIEQRKRPRIARIVALGIALWIVAVILPIYLLFYYEFGSTYIDMIIFLSAIYFGLIPVVAILFLIYDFIHILAYRRLRFANKTWYLLFLVFAILSLLFSWIAYGTVSQRYIAGSP
jgi:hypothetical protein